MLPAIPRRRSKSQQPGCWKHLCVFSGIGRWPMIGSVRGIAPLADVPLASRQCHDFQGAAISRSPATRRRAYSSHSSPVGDAVSVPWEADCSPLQITRPVVPRHGLLYNNRVVMRRTVTAALLCICLGVFLCPAVGKPTVPEQLPQTKANASCAEAQHDCDQDADSIPPNIDRGHSCCHRPARHSQSTHCCPAPCSLLVLMCSSAETERAPAFTSLNIFADDWNGAIRRDRPPSPPPRV